MPKPAARKTIAVDIDDVLAAEAEAIVDHSNKYWGHTLALDDYKEHWGEMWQVDQVEAERRADVLHSPGMVSSYRLLQNAHEALKRLSSRYRLIIITSRRRIVERETRDWLEQNFKDIFEEVHFTGFWDKPGPHNHTLTKAAIAKKKAVDYLIDDQPKHCFSAAQAGIKAILFGNYAESRHIALPENVTRCLSWQEVLEYFNAES